MDIVQAPAREPDTLAAYLLARLNDDDARLHAPGVKLVEPDRSEDDSFRLLVGCWDQVACARSVVNAYIYADPNHPMWTVLRRIALILVQPYEQHDGFDPYWLVELGVPSNAPKAG